MILPKIRDPRFITIRRGGSLTDERHHLLAVWAARCAEHVLALFESERPGDGRPRKAVELAHAWSRGEVTVDEAKRGAYHANAAARDLKGAAKFAALAAGQAAAVAHVAAHELGAAAYAIRAVMAAGGEAGRIARGKAELEWQRSRLPPDLKDLVLEDEKNRSDICWNVFDL
ncbi:MAG: hypothetical protein JNG85_13075 [Spirochaetaceae bacterium]|nr:hypothetical protein [Spirochaetaceae bacterium]